MSSPKVGNLARRDGIDSVAAPGMAARQSPCGESGAAERAVPCDCFQGVLRAGGSETAPHPERSEQARQHRRKHHAISADGQDQKMLGGIQTASLSSLPRLSTDKKSASTWVKLLPTMDCLATKTKSIGWRSSYW